MITDTISEAEAYISEKCLLYLLGDYLAGSNDAPLKAAILKEGLGEEVRAGLSAERKQSFFQIMVRNSDLSKKAAVKAVIRQTLEKVAEEGVDREQMRALLNRMEFRYREQAFEQMPKGIVYGLGCLENWLYGGAPAEGLSDLEAIEALKVDVERDYFENLIRKVLLESQNFALVSMAPDDTLRSKKLKKEQMEMAALQAGWSDEEYEQYKAFDHRLKAWQSTPDDAATLQSIPKLCLSDMAQPPKEIPMTRTQIEGCTVLRHSLPTRGISYLTLYFPAMDLTLEELPLATFLAALCGKLNTKSYSAAELKKQIETDLGDFDTHMKVINPAGAADQCKLYFVVEISVLCEKWNTVLTYLKEILLTSDFSDEKKVREILAQQREGMQQSIMRAGHIFGVKRVFAMSSASGVAEECLGGYTYARWLKAQQERPVCELCESLAALARKLITANDLCISVTEHAKGSTSEGTDSERMIREIVQSFPAGSKKAGDAAYLPFPVRREGIAIPSNVSYAVMGTQLVTGSETAEQSGAEAQVTTDAELQVLQRVMSLSYLWEAIRVQGGAYGAGMQMTESKKMFLYSYRDPNPANTLQVCEGIPQAMAQIFAADWDMEGMILGALSQKDPLMTIRNMAAISDARFLSGMTYDRIGKEWQEMLKVTPAKLLQLKDMMTEALKNSGVCVVGVREQLEKCRLDEILQI